MKIEVKVQTDKVGSECVEVVEIDEEEANQMDDVDLEIMAKDVMFGMIEWNWKRL